MADEINVTFEEETIEVIIEAAVGLSGPTGPAGADGSDAEVTKENVEAVLIGDITSHTHDSQYLDEIEFSLINIFKI